MFPFNPIAIGINEHNMNKHPPYIHKINTFPSDSLWLSALAIWEKNPKNAEVTNMTTPVTKPMMPTMRGMVFRLPTGGEFMPTTCT